ncbi:hypothetical protein [Streptomyces lunaelactis]|uniref:hypothetical protein n=1 Tax=Streptomyces lunaelactis TaxID=1535768 RepID=UPI0015856545|nr:hypothetical protein [Streptomyces lunaelactis]NUL13050.1 hypothetical protein [Streptomyces lunaelactis]
MPTTPPHAVALAAMLAAATGSEPRIAEAERQIRVEADPPAELSHTVRDTILRALGAADRYGHNRTSTTDTVWAEIDREAKR